MSRSLQPSLMIVSAYLPPEGGGVETYIEQVVRELRVQDNWRIVLVTTHDSDQVKLVKREDGVRVYFLPRGIKLSNSPLHIKWFSQLRHIIQEEKPAAINVHMPVPGIGDITALAAPRRIPLIVTYHFGSMVKGGAIMRFVLSIYEKFFLPYTFKRAAKIICCSEFVQEEFLPERFRAKSEVITPAVDTQLFSPLKRAGKNNQIVFVGSLNRAQTHKGVYELLEAVALLKKRKINATLLIAGQGDNREAYEARAKELSVNGITTFAGNLRGKALREAMRASTVMAHPSTMESFGMVVAEAMACGLPVVGANAEGLPYVLEDKKTGLLHKPKDVKDLADKLALLLSDREMAANMGKAGRIKATASYSLQAQHDETKRVLQPFATGQRPITHVVSYYPPSLGGMENVVQAIAQQHVKDGLAVRVLTSNRNAQGHNDVTDLPDVQRLPSFEFAHTPVMRGLFTRLMRTPKNGVIHLHVAQAYSAEVTWLAAKLRRVPYIAHFHLDVAPSGPLGFLFIAYKKLILPRVLRGAARVIALTPDQKTLLMTRYKVKNERITVLPNGVLGSFFKEPRTPHKPLRLVFVGRLAHQKRVERLVGAMGLMKKPAHLTIVGDGEDRAKLEALAAKLKLGKKVTFTGAKYGADTVAAYHDADVFVLPSDREGMPLCLLEAAASGLAIVGSHVVGITDLIDGTGILVDNPSDKTFATALDALASDPARVKDLAAKSFTLAQSYSWETLGKRLQQIYQEVSV